MGVHDGHRKRMKSRFRQEGAGAMRDHELLELLLFYAIPRADTNSIAHALLVRFGSLRGVLEAPVDALGNVPGVGEHAATLLKVMSAVHGRVQEQAMTGPCTLATSADAAAYLAPRYQDVDCECVYLLCLDGRRRVTCCEEVARGAPTQVEISVRTVAELALRNAAKGVILSHNHPAAPPIPSREDEMVTLQISEALSALGITLVDHIILSDEEYISMADSGILTHARRPYRPQIL